MGTLRNFKMQSYSIYLISRLKAKEYSLLNFSMKYENILVDSDPLPLCLCSLKGFPPRAQNFPD